jgi:hypothetical protein
MVADALANAPFRPHDIQYPFRVSGAVRRWSDAEVYAYLSHREWRLAYYKSREQTKGVDLSYMGHGYLGCRKFVVGSSWVVVDSSVVVGSSWVYPLRLLQQSNFKLLLTYCNNSPVEPPVSPTFKFVQVSATCSPMLLPRQQNVKKTWPGLVDLDSLSQDLIDLNNLAISGPLSGPRNIMYPRMYQDFTGKNTATSILRFK